MKKVKFVDQPICKNCGGQHYGSPLDYCPYIKSACVVCGAETIYSCSDCAIDSSGKKSVHVCPKVACQREHETLHPDHKLQDLSPHIAGGTRAPQEENKNG